jgi:transcriptional regulator with XRE-family HTH domain
LLGLSSSTYARLERNEVSCEFDQLQRFSSILGLPVTDFLPDTLTLHNNITGKGVGIIFGNYIVNYYTTDYRITELEKENELLKEEIAKQKPPLGLNNDPS